MSEQGQPTGAPVAETEPDLPAGGDAETVEGSTPVTEPEFQELDGASSPKGDGFELSRFSNVQVELSVELGRTQISIQDLMKLSEGSVIELDRAINAPVELVSQGVRMGNGEVVVIDDRFAIRIKQIYQNT